MVSEVKVVIGANAGDEGKGLVTDYFAHKAVSRGKRVLNILGNGGPQRGHTVSVADGRRHVFHHFGSGAFAGADTFCPATFLVNPLEFRRESYELCEQGWQMPKTFISPRCRFTTPYDMMTNCILEERRGEKRHGSCGMGIWETVLRYSQTFEMAFSIGEMMNLSRDDQKTVLNYIREHQRVRLLREGIRQVPDKWASHWNSPELVEQYIASIEYMKTMGYMCHADHSEYDMLLYENGQGLLLGDEEDKDDVHTTPSRTGLASEANSILWHTHGCRGTDVEVCYVTRTYLTRHGAGELKGECDKAEIGNIVEDQTNIPNPYQGTLRYAPLDTPDLINRTGRDFSPYIKHGWRCSLAVTHTNEVPIWIDDFKKHFHTIYTSNGCCREQMKKVFTFNMAVKNAEKG